MFGKGGFFTVSEVKSIQLHDSDDEEEEELIEVANPEDDDHILGVVQNRRFMARLDNPDKNWKFEPRDVVERRSWNDYMQAYEAALNATSRPWAPWYAIPADDKTYMRARVADIIIATLQSIGLKYPEPSEKDRQEFVAARDELLSEKD